VGVKTESTNEGVFELEPQDNLRLANLCGQFDEHLRMIEQRVGVEIRNRGASFEISGDKALQNKTKALLLNIYEHTKQEVITPAQVHLFLQEIGADDNSGIDIGEEVIITTRRNRIRGRGINQKQYLKSILKNDINFGIGPAGTGKTYLAVACAIDALEKNQVRRLVLTRPAVEAGEKLGFLPGDLAQKIDPYLRPLYDALYEMLGFDQVMALMERNVIEVAPLAYMRGRTLNEAFVILDEAQNTSVEQMKMFLTRIGFGSKAVVTGDVTQIDLPKSIPSGLKQVQTVLDNVEGIGFTHFKTRDVIRHPLVQKIVRAYEDHEDQNQ
jgi:phosphate starvation-inducible protein PhoH and related proteins